jgi:Zn-dependent protease with chaperone function
MRTLVLMLLMMLAAVAANAAEIDEVLQRSQQQRLHDLPEARTDDARVAIVRRSFERVCAAMQIGVPIELRVVSGPVVAESLLGRVVVANQSLGDVPEGERLFVLAHEIGHVAHGHWASFATLWRTHLPGAVVQQETDRIAPVLGPEASALMHAHELDADAFALGALSRLGHGFDSAMATFLRQGVQHDTATHPGTRKRVAHLRTLL